MTVFYDRIVIDCAPTESVLTTTASLANYYLGGKKNKSSEKILEKAVAMLAERGHMPEWFNQCPVALGITGPRVDRKRAVDLVR